MIKSIVLFTYSLFAITFSTQAQEITKLGTTVNLIESPSNSSDEFTYLGQIGAFHYGYDYDSRTSLKSKFRVFKLDEKYNILASNEIENLYNPRAQAVELKEIKIINGMITVLVIHDDKKADRTFIEANTISPETLQKIDTKTIVDVPQVKKGYYVTAARFRFNHSNTPSGEYTVSYQQKKNASHITYFVNGDHTVAHTEEISSHKNFTIPMAIGDMDIIEFNIDSVNFGFLAKFQASGIDTTVYFNFNRTSQKLTRVEIQLTEECPYLNARTAITQKNQLLVVGFSQHEVENKKWVQKKCVRFYDLESGALLKEAFYPTNYDSSLPDYAEDDRNAYIPKGSDPVKVYANPDGTFNFISHLAAIKSHTSSNGVTTYTYYFGEISNHLLTEDGDFIEEMKCPRYFKTKSYDGREGFLLPYINNEGIRIVYATSDGLEVAKFDKKSGQTSTEKFYQEGYEGFITMIEGYDFNPISIRTAQPGVFWVDVDTKNRSKYYYLAVDFNQ